MTDYTYCVTAQPSTAVTHSMTGNFTGEEELNLIVGKITRFEIFLMTPEGLELIQEVPINGRIETMKLMRPRGARKDRLFICTDAYQYCVLEYEEETKKIKTLTTGTIKREYKVYDNGMLGAIDPTSTFIALHMNDCVLKIIRTNVAGVLQDRPTVVSINEKEIISLCFLEGYEQPTILILYQDPRQARHLKTYTLTNPMTLDNGPWQQPNVERSSHTVIPIPKPMGGVLIIGEYTIVYYNGDNFRQAQMNATFITCYGRVDTNGSRWLLGDLLGNLFVVVLTFENSIVTRVHLETIGQTHKASTLSYLDNGVVYVGSAQGDPQLVKLNSEKDQETGSYIEVLEVHKNLGPIVDLAVVDLDRGGQEQVVTCSGYGRDGSLRVVRSGISINEQASIEMPGIKGIWSLRDSFDTQYDKYLVESFVGDTRILCVTEEGLEEIEIDGFEEAQTIYCANVVNDQLLQVTDNCVRLVSCSNLQVNSQWKPSHEVRINVASSNPSQALVATSGGIVVLLNITGTDLVEATFKRLDKEVACLNIAAVGDNKLSSKIAVVGMWEDNTLRLLNIPSLEEVCRKNLGDIIPRSVLFVDFPTSPYLLCGLGDGFVVSWELNGTKLSNEKKVAIGTRPLVLSTFETDEKTHVFASCDRPTIIQMANGKLIYTNVNLEQVNYMSSFNAELFPGCLSFGMEESLLIGTIGEMRKLHIKDVPLGEMPRRIAHSHKSHVYCVTTLVPKENLVQMECKENSYIKLIDDQTFEVIDSYELRDWETGSCLITHTFTGDDTEYFLVGTAVVKNDEPEPVLGRIIVIKVVEKKIDVVVESEVQGAVYSLASLRGMLAAGINSKVWLYEWKNDGSDKKILVSLAERHGHVLALFLKCRGDFIIVGDLMKSISLLSYRNGNLEELARDFNSNWVSACEMFDDQVFIGAENQFNLFTVKKNTSAITEGERRKLDLVGCYHLGEFVNVIKHGSLVYRSLVPDIDMANSLPPLEPRDLPDLESRSDKMDGKEDEMKIQQRDFHFSSNLRQKLIFGTVGGSIGVIASLTKQQFDFLDKIQKVMQKEIDFVGGFDHELYRRFFNDSITRPAQNFVDGDLVENVINLPIEQVTKIASGVGVSTDFLIRQIDDLSRIK